MAAGITFDHTKDEPHAMLTPSIQLLTDTQTVLFDAGRGLLTGAVTLFLGYAIVVLGALLLSAIAGAGARRREAWASRGAIAPMGQLEAQPAHGGLSGVVAMSGDRSVRVRS